MLQNYRQIPKDSAELEKAKMRNYKLILILPYVQSWVLVMLVMWLVKGPFGNQCALAFRGMLLPLGALLVPFFTAKSNFWGRANWLAIPIIALTFLLVPDSRYIEEAGVGSQSFLWPDFIYMLVGAALSAAGLIAGKIFYKKKQAEADSAAE